MLFLKKLIIYGFKSFAFRTELEFKEGVAGIVGPNGCGKSNIFDALKWVFGEKSSRAMRGENSLDIIFAGTEIHKPMGLSEVEIVIDNSNMFLPLKYNEISIKRKTFRSGETEYYINKNSVRLKDIHDLFADTGIGKGAYSFMEQGKIDMILSSKPDERRIIFEEAAGIAKYKSRKKETLTKIELTNNNLEQVNILLKELDNERKSLKIQVEKAKVYNEKKEKLKELEILLFGNKYKKNTRKLKDVDKKIIELNDKKTRIKTENSSINSEIEKINSIIYKFNDTKNKFEKDKLTFEMRIKAHADKIDFLNDLCGKNGRDIKLKKEQINVLIKENKNIENKITELKNELAKFKNEQDENEKKLAEINEQRKRLKEKKILNIEEKEKLKIEIEKNNRRVEELRIELKKVTDEFVAQIDKKKKELEGQQHGRPDLKTKINNLLEKIIKDLNDFYAKGEKKKPQEILTALNELKKLIGNFSNLQDEFKDLIFDEKGPYAKKEKIDLNIHQLRDMVISSQHKINLIETDNERFTRQISDLSEKYSELDKVRNDIKHYIINHNKEISNFKDSLIKNKSYERNLEAEIKNIENNSIKLTNEMQTLNKEIDNYSGKCDNIDKKILQYEEEMNEQQEIILKQKGKIIKLAKNIEEMESSIENHIKLKYDIEAQLTGSKEHLYNEFNVKVEEILEKIQDDINEKKISDKINDLKQEINKLGHVNPLAEEFYEDVNKRYEFHIDQKNDLLKAKDDLLKIIEEVNVESKKMFLDTFNDIRKNFHDIFRRMFGGGKADLILMDPDNVLESGIEINAQPPGKKINSYAWLSGGERTLLAIGLMFAIFQVRPSPFCIMDEIDAALDEENNTKFLMIMKEFSKNTQFFIITHNRMTIANTSYLYGITMEEKGISKVVSLELKKEKIDDYIK